jgi:heme exporter protein B
MSAGGTLFVRDVRLSLRAGGGAALALGFFAAVTALVPLGIGPEMLVLARIAGGIVWVAAALATLISLDRLFQADYDDGSLDVIVLAPLSLESIVFAKMAAHWVTTGLPLTLVSPLLAMLFDLPTEGAVALMASLALGTPALSAVGAIGAALTLSVRRGGLILAAIVLPLIVPAVIFGAAAVISVLGGLGLGAFYLLAAYAVFTVAMAPFAAAAAVRLNLAA